MEERQPVEPTQPVLLGESELEVVTTELPPVRTFTSLGTPNYLWYWLSSVASFAGLQMQIIARGWLVWQMTGSELALGLVSFAFGVPIFLFSLFGGALADRLNKRDLLIATQAFNVVVTLAIAVLISLGMIEMWHLIAAAVATGFSFVVNGPARQSIIPHLVQKRELLNAISLNATAMNVTRVVGFALGGALLPLIDFAGVYYLVVAFYVISTALLFFISMPAGDEESAPMRRRTPAGGEMDTGPYGAATRFMADIWADLKEGLGYIRHSTLVIMLLAMAFVPLTFGLPYMNLMPAFADDVLGLGDFGYAMLLMMTGVGALIASLTIASLGDFKRKGMLLIYLALGFGITLALFSMSHSYVLSLIILVGVGAGSTGYMAVNNTLIQSNVPRHMLGRVMSIYMVTFALMPMGTLPIGAIAEAIGPATAVGAGAVVVIVFTLAVALFLPRLRRLE